MSRAPTKPVNSSVGWAEERAPTEPLNNISQARRPQQPMTDAPNPNHIRVTGGCGFIGVNRVPLLESSGYFVRVLDDLSKAAPTTSRAPTRTSASTTSATAPLSRRPWKESTPSFTWPPTAPRSNPSRTRRRTSTSTSAAPSSCSTRHARPGDRASSSPLPAVPLSETPSPRWTSHLSRAPSRPAAQASFADVERRLTPCLQSSHQPRPPQPRRSGAPPRCDLTPRGAARVPAPRPALTPHPSAQRPSPMEYARRARTIAAYRESRAGSALLFSLSLWESAGVRETTLAPATFMF